MERALKSFLDGVSEDDNVVNLDHVVKNDNNGEEEEEEDKVAVIAQGSSSGMLDIRAMAQRYQEMSASTKMEVVTPEAPLPGQILRDHLLAPVVEGDEEPSQTGWIFAAAGGLLVTIIVTAAVTAVLVKRSVMAEIDKLNLVPGVAQVEAAPEPVPATPEAVAVAEWPEPDPTLVAAVADSEEESSMDFEGEAIDVKRRDRNRDSEEKPERVRPAVDPAVAAAMAAPSPAPAPAPVAVPAPTPTPAPAPAPAPVAASNTADDGEVCDEVLCLVEGKGCCGKARKLAASEPEVDTSLPERLSRADIATGLKKINGRLNSCGARHETTGVVTLKLKISPEGKVKSSSTNKGHVEFQSCIGKTLSKARFARTQEGASLSYPVILR